jgi:uncharacterized protein (TIGR02147 family)
MKITTIWNYDNYKLFISDFFANFPGNGRGQFKKLAEKLKVHSTLISQIIKGPKHFSFEQAYGVTRFLGLNENETEYFFELLSYEKAGTADLQKYHKNRMSKLIIKSQTITARVGKSHELSEEDKLQYYSDWKYIAIWLATSINSLKDETGIATRFNLTREEVMEIMQFLLDKGLCTRSDLGLAMNISKTHIPAGSPLTVNHHLNWRLKGIDFVRNVSSDELAFTAPFSVSKKDFGIIKDKILALIEDISKLVSKSEPEVVACLNIDQFFVIKD